jgi:hypothetical protein
MKLSDFIVLGFFYILISFVLYLVLGNSILAWIYYAFSLLPFYSFLMITLIVINLDRKIIVYNPWWLVPIVISQVGLILTCPSSCFNWKSGQSCYSWLQANFSNVTNNPPHWKVGEYFEILLLVHILTVLLSLIQSKITNQ